MMARDALRFEVERQRPAVPEYRAPLRPAGVVVWLLALVLLAWVSYRLVNKWLIW